MLHFLCIQRLEWNFGQFAVNLPWQYFDVLIVSKWQLIPVLTLKGIDPESSQEELIKQRAKRTSIRYNAAFYNTNITVLILNRYQMLCQSLQGKITRI